MQDESALVHGGPPTPAAREPGNRNSARGLRRSVLFFGRIVVLVGLFWGLIGLGMGEVTLAAVGGVAFSFGAWLLFVERRSGYWSAESLAMIVAVGTEITAVIAVAVEPIIGPAIALGSLIPIVVALVYVSRRTLAMLTLCSIVVGAFAALAPSIIPWGVRGTGPLELLLPTSTLVIVYVLFQVFLWHASARLTDTATELRHVVAMSRDLAGTMEPTDVGHQLARHLRAVARASECTLSTWDRERDRVVTFGFDPPEFGERIEPSYALARFPATRNVLAEQHVMVLDTADPMADVSEVGYLRSIGRERSVMIPLVVRGESIGIVELTSSDHRAFDENQIELASVLAGEAALTFDNARLHGEIREQAFRDPLTGLANRSRFQERVQHSLDRLRRRSNVRAAVLFIDLDHFKLVNDRFGHTVGDRLLQAVAHRVGSAVRPGDTAARLGGDEFAILLEDIEGKDDAEAVCRRLLDLLSEPVSLGQASPTIGASIGVAISGLGGETVDELLRNADIAMYAAKAAGRGQVVFFRSELLDLAAARSELAALLRGAEARGELQLHFQPIVRLDSGTPVGLEALVRWQPQGHVLHMPAEFIGLAEETGEILAIGRWVLAEACKRAKAWQERFGLPDLRIYVNLSARQFRDPGLLAIVGGALRDARLEARHLTLEITETALLSRTPDTLERIGHLRRLGVRLAIDDFGTGYSSLGYLHAFQVDELKIDRSFVSGYRGVAEAEAGGSAIGAAAVGAIGVSGTSASSGAGRHTPRRDAKVLSRAIVELGRALGLDMVAEGIETESQADWFRELGCLYGQGFYFAKPLAPTDVERFLRRRTRLVRVRPDGTAEPIRKPATAASAGQRAICRPRLPRPRPITPPAD